MVPHQAVLDPRAGGDVAQGDALAAVLGEQGERRPANDCASLLDGASVLGGTASGAGDGHDSIIAHLDNYR